MQNKDSYQDILEKARKIEANIFNIAIQKNIYFSDDHLYIMDYIIKEFEKFGFKGFIDFKISSVDIIKHAPLSYAYHIYMDKKQGNMEIVVRGLYKTLVELVKEQIATLTYYQSGEKSHAT